MADSGNRAPEFGINAYVPRPPFVAFHNRIQRWAAMVCHRRAGKTVGCVADVVLSALVTPKQDARFAYVAPQYNQAKDIAWAYVKRLTDDIPRVEYNESELRADLPNGARVRLYGADNPDRLRGIYLDGVVLDEYADMKPRVWGEIIRPLLTDRKGWAAFIGTPKGHNEFYAMWRYALATEDWFALMLKSSDSGLMDAAEMADAQRSMTADQYAQEFECSFEAALQGAYFGQEMAAAEQAGRITSVEWDIYAKVFTAWDLGRRDDTAIWWFQIIRDEIHVIDFHASSGATIPFYCNIIKNKPYKYAVHWLPHDAKAATLASGGKSVIEQMAAELGLGNMAIVPSLSVEDGIQAARLAIGRCWFDRTKCDDGIESLKQYQKEWNDDTKSFREKPRHDWTSHAADAFRMLAIAWKENEPPPKPAEPMRGLAVGNPHKVTLNEMWDAIPKHRTERI